MSLYAIDVTFTDPGLVTRRGLCITPTDFLRRFENLDRQFEKDSLDIRTNLTLTDEQKDELLAELHENYENEKVAHPNDDATCVSASIMTGKTYSFRRYDSIAELEKELRRPYGNQKGA